MVPRTRDFFKVGNLPRFLKHKSKVQIKRPKFSSFSCHKINDMVSEINLPFILGFFTANNAYWSKQFYGPIKFFLTPQKQKVNRY